LVARITSRQGRPTGSDSHDTETAVSSSDTVSCCYPGRHIVWDVTVPLNWCHWLYFYDTKTLLCLVSWACHSSITDCTLVTQKHLVTSIT